METILKFKGPAQVSDITLPPGGQSAVIPLAAGIWEVEIESSYKGGLYAQGVKSNVEVKPGRTTPCSIQMNYAGGPLHIEGMEWIDAGSFYMGSPGTELLRGGYEDQHKVTLTQGFYMGKYPVTQKQWEEVMGMDVPLNQVISASPSFGVGDDYPMYWVNWYDALVFCNKLSIMEGLTPAYSIYGSTDPAAWGSVPTSLTGDPDWDAAQIIAGSTGYRLPTEAQWEYACRGDYSNKDTETNTMPFGIGDGTKIKGDMANFDGTYPYDINFPAGEYNDLLGTFLHKTTPVGSYDPNNYGLYDMHGNVQEWCWDWYDNYSGTATDPAGAFSGSSRIIRGGIWDDYGQYLRSACRGSFIPGNRYADNGFRLVRP